LCHHRPFIAGGQAFAASNTRVPLSLTHHSQICTVALL
jgi:hypothetical protein